MKETFCSKLRELWAIRRRCQQIKLEQRQNRLPRSNEFNAGNENCFAEKSIVNQDYRASLLARPNPYATGDLQGQSLLAKRDPTLAEWLKKFGESPYAAACEWADAWKQTAGNYSAEVTGSSNNQDHGKLKGI